MHKAIQQSHSSRKDHKGSKQSGYGTHFHTFIKHIEQEHSESCCRAWPGNKKDKTGDWTEDVTTGRRGKYFLAE
eukprot:7033153-Heterocapsa_arctica.AAC.1